jgi:L-lactate dehydrogenase complex protein LldG
MSQPRVTLDQFLRPIREALGRTGAMSAPPTPPVISDELVRLTKADVDLPAVFTENARAVGMQVRPVDKSKLGETVAELLRELDCKSVALTIDKLDEAGAIRQAVEAAGVQLRAWRGDRSMEAHFQADASVTDVHAALAETGTIICNSDADHARGASIAVPVHVAIVRRADILPDMLDYIATLSGKSPVDLPSAQAFITGPSKTADIEGVLITGVHGPGKVIVLLVD